MGVKRRRNFREPEPPPSRGLLRAILAAGLGASLACNAVLGNESKSRDPVPLSGNSSGSAQSSGDASELTPEPGPPLPLRCTDSCPLDGAKRCSSSSSAGVEICARSAEGCLAWKQDADCAPDFSCDTVKNDGSCKAGCTNDTGCDAGKVATTRCVLPSGPNGTAEQTCSVVGACYQWKTTRSSIPQDCAISGSYCVFGARKNCVASASGACTQHVSQANDCAQGSSCQGAGQCAQAPLCGTGLTCASGFTTGASPCSQSPPSGPVIYCCASGKTIVGGKCV